MSRSPRKWNRLSPALFVALAIGGCMDHPESASSLGRPAATSRTEVVRYQVTDIERRVDFYTRGLDFRLEMRAGWACASVTRGALRLILSGPGSSGSRP